MLCYFIFSALYYFIFQTLGSVNLVGHYVILVGYQPKCHKG
jgi:hypothetical protein